MWLFHRSFLFFFVYNHQYLLHFLIIPLLFPPFLVPHYGNRYQNKSPPELCCACLHVGLETCPDKKDSLLSAGNIIYYGKVTVGPVA